MFSPHTFENQVQPLESLRTSEMVTLYTDTRMLDHVPAPGHPERPERLRNLLRQLERSGVAELCRMGKVRPATDAELCRVHTDSYLRLVRSLADHGGGHIEADTWMSAGSEAAARLAAGAVVESIAAVIEGADPVAFCAVRPPGHHARPAEAMGFCIYANVAVGVADALERLGLERVLIVDWDVHHGNGTQEIFYEEPRVGFFSIHRYPFYPGTGAADETGAGRGIGRTRNVPVAYGTPRPSYLDAFRKALESVADRIRPELIVISAGFDAHAQDPVGDLGLEVEDFVQMTQNVIDVARVHSRGRIVSVLEGGYNVPILAGCVESHLGELGARPQTKKT
jgi:acetoin utilization deacetylase AcuC-like enzyme